MPSVNNQETHHKSVTLIPIVICVLLLVALFFLAWNAKKKIISTESTYTPAITTARNLMWKDINSGKAASAEVAIMDNGKIVYSEGFGMADRAKNIPVDSNTIFNIGSVSKVYVAAAIMKLVDQGKVKLDAPITKYIPEFTMADPRYKDITVRMVLDHSNGLPGSNYANSMEIIKPNVNMQKDTLNTLAQSHLKAAPGEVSPYTNDGFTLAEIIVERVSGQKYIDFITKNILQPLGLNNTGLSVAEVKNKQIAKTYDPITGKAKLPEAVSVLGAGGLSATAIDLCRFADGITQNNTILSSASIAELKKSQPSKLAMQLGNNASKFGLGWDITTIPFYEGYGLQILGKDGGTEQYNSMVYIIPSKRICVAGIEAGPATNTDANINAILNKVLIAKGLIPQEKKTVDVPLPHESIPSKYADYSGYYVATGGDVKHITIDTKNNIVTSHAILNSTPDTTYFYNNGHFTNDSMGSHGYLDFVTIDGEQYAVLHSNSMQMDNIAMQKAKTVKPVSLKIDMTNKGWLQRNVNTYDEPTDFALHMVTSNLIKEMPGYVDFNGSHKIQSPTFAEMPVSSMRDLTELQLVDKNDETWVLNSDRLYSPAEKTIALQIGENAITIGKEGYNEWRQAQSGVMLSAEKLPQGRVIVFDPNDTVLYDSTVDTDDVYIPARSFVEFLGSPNETIQVTTLLPAKK